LQSFMRLSATWGRSMAVWTLTPVDPDHPSWAASSHRGPAVVRARNEVEARAVAARAFDIKTGDIKTGFAPGQGVHFPPWTRAALVRAEHVDDPRFAAEGPAELLEPSF